MDALSQKVVDAVDAGNGSVLWGDVVSTLSERERGNLQATVRQLTKQGKVRRDLRIVEGQPVLSLVRMSE